MKRSEAWLIREKGRKRDTRIYLVALLGQARETTIRNEVSLDPPAPCVGGMLPQNRNVKLPDVLFAWVVSSSHLIMPVQ